MMTIIYALITEAFVVMFLLFMVKIEKERMILNKGRGAPIMYLGLFVIIYALLFYYGTFSGFIQ